MRSLIIFLLTVIGFAAARSLPSNYMTSGQQTSEKWRVARSEVDLTSSTNNANPTMNQFMAELANLSIPDYLKDLFINLTNTNETTDSSKNTKVNTIRSYENQAKSKLILIWMYVVQVLTYR